MVVHIPHGRVRRWRCRVLRDHQRVAPATGDEAWPEHHRLAIEQLPAILWSTDNRLRFNSLRGAGLARLGLRSDDVIGHRVTELFTTGDPDHALISAHQRALGGELVIFDTEWRERYFHIWLQPLREPGGTIVGTSGLALDVTERRQAEVALHERESRLQLALDIADMATWDWDLASGSIVRSNRMAALYGLPTHTLEGLLDAHFDRIHPGDRDKIERMDQLHLEQGVPYDLEYRVVWPDGSVHWLRERADSMRDEDGRPVRLLGVTMDVTAGKEAEASLRRSESRFRALVQNALDMITILGKDGTILYDSPANERVLGYAPDENLGINAFSLVHPDDRPSAWDRFTNGLAQPGASISAEFQFRHKDGSWRWLEAVGVNLLDDPAVRGIVVNSRGITERKAFEERLTYLAFHDALTGLPNRLQFEERLADALAKPYQQVAVLFMDIDGFKAVNDSLGHTIGDQLLGAVASRLATAIRDGTILARFGGDEFAVLLAPGGSVAEATRLAQRLLNVLATPFTIGGLEVVVRASIGIAACAPGVDMPKDLLRAVDVALYRAKAVARGDLAVFDPRLDEAALDRLAHQTELRHAVERAELRLAYQPIVNLATGVIVGLEALVRWHHPRRGLLYPAEFIPLAEETGLIVPLSRWVLSEACRQMRGWHQRLPRQPPLQLYVNLSGREFQQPMMLADLAAILSELAFDPASLTLEITESAAIADVAAAQATLASLKSRGVQVAIDDFGIGYAALSSLKSLPVDEIKVDASFVAGIGTVRVDQEIVRAIASVARALGLGLTAEGIETAAQAKALLDLGCQQGQGHFFARPLWPEDCTALLDRRDQVPESPDVTEPN